MGCAQGKGTSAGSGVFVADPKKHAARSSNAAESQQALNNRSPNHRSQRQMVSSIVNQSRLELNFLNDENASFTATTNKLMQQSHLNSSPTNAHGRKQQPLHTGNVKIEILTLHENAAIGEDCSDEVIAKITRFSPKKQLQAQLFPRYKNSIDQLSVSPSTASTSDNPRNFGSRNLRVGGVVQEKSEFEEQGTNHDLIKAR